MRRSKLLLCTAALATAGTLPAVAQGAAPDTAAVRVGLTALNMKLQAAYLAGDVGGIVALYTEDARAEFAGFPSAVGRPALQATYEAYFKANKLKVFESVITGVNALSADLVTAGGTVHEFLTSSGKPVHGWWRWAAAYRKGADGQYKISFVMAFPDSTK